MKEFEIRLCVNHSYMFAAGVAQPLGAQRPPPSALFPLSHLSNVVQTRLDGCLIWQGAKSPKADEVA
jgi:hypothetical protein